SGTGGSTKAQLQVVDGIGLQLQGGSGNAILTAQSSPQAVGIGTQSPVGILDVEGGAAGGSGNGTNIKIVAQNGGPTGSTNGGNILLIPGTPNGGGSSGSVGIGTLTPLAALDVTAMGSNTISAIIVPRDTQANRPSAPINGMIR